MFSSNSATFPCECRRPPPLIALIFSPIGDFLSGTSQQLHHTFSPQSKCRRAFSYNRWLFFSWKTTISGHRSFVKPSHSAHFSTNDEHFFLSFFVFNHDDRCSQFLCLRVILDSFEESKTYFLTKICVHTTKMSQICGTNIQLLLISNGFFCCKITEKKSNQQTKQFRKFFESCHFRSRFFCKAKSFWSLFSVFPWISCTFPHKFSLFYLFSDIFRTPNFCKIL